VLPKQINLLSVSLSCCSSFQAGREHKFIGCVAHDVIMAKNKKSKTKDDDNHNQVRQRRRGRVGVLVQPDRNNQNSNNNNNKMVNTDPSKRSLHTLFPFYLVFLVMTLVLCILTMRLWGRNRDDGMANAGSPPRYTASSSEPKRTLDRAASSTTSTPPTVWTVITRNYQLLHTYQHDPTSFTQGLTIAKQNKQKSKDNNNNSSTTTTTTTTMLLVESTGMYGRSLLRVWNPETQHIHYETSLEDQYFGEGMTSFTIPSNHNNNNNADTMMFYLVLTYREGKALIYSTEETFHLVQTIDIPSTYHNEGWGITFQSHDQTKNNNNNNNNNNDKNDLIFYVTDGSHFLHVWKLQYQYHSSDENYPTFSFLELNRIPISVKRQHHDDTRMVHQQQYVERLNELEYDATTNTILANVWFDPVILRIDPQLGIVTCIYDLSPLAEPMKEAALKDRNIVMNGIALVPNSTQINESGILQQQDILVTGKYWSQLYKVRIFQ
jgi:glutamine cyclotransferase